MHVNLNEKKNLAKDDERKRTTVYFGSYLSRLTPHTNIGASAEGAEITTFFAPPFKCADALERSRF